MRPITENKLPEEVSKREKAAAWSETRARHGVKCSMMPGQRMTNRRPLKELCENGKITEDRIIWKLNYKVTVK